MKVHDTVTEFVENYKPTIGYLKGFYQKQYPHYEEYFSYHCKNIGQKLALAIPRHQEKLEDLIFIKGEMPRLIKEIQSAYEGLYDVSFTADVHLLVGMFGSNAFAYRQINPELAFCLEKLPPVEHHLKIIIAHEFGHALQHLLSSIREIDWKKIDWESPYTWLLQEGCAVYFSKRVVTAREDEYFAFEEDWEWLLFAESHKREITGQFIKDIEALDSGELYKEWFSINGGETFGHTRLAYYIAYETVKSLIDQYGELAIVTSWAAEDFKRMMRKKLKQIADEPTPG